MNSSNERESFSQRLQLALKNAHYSPDSPTRLAREFNIRFDGRPITVHAARKWLVGEAIPTQEKLRMIAHGWAFRRNGCGLAARKAPRRMAKRAALYRVLSPPM